MTTTTTTKVKRFFTAIAVIGAALFVTGVMGTNLFPVNDTIWTFLILVGAWFVVIGVWIRWKAARAQRAS